MLPQKYYACYFMKQHDTTFHILYFNPSSKYHHIIHFPLVNFLFTSLSRHPINVSPEYDIVCLKTAYNKEPSNQLCTQI